MIDSTSVLGVPFLLSFLGQNEIIVASALSLFAGLGDLMPPTALAGADFVRSENDVEHVSNRRHRLLQAG